MKFHFFISALIIIACGSSACNKQGTTAPAVNPVDTSKGVDSIFRATSNLPVAVYIGSMVANATYGCSGDAPYPEKDSDVAFVFNGTNVNNDTLRFWMQKQLYFDGFGDSMSIGGTFKKNTLNNYVINLSNDQFTLKIMNDSLYVIGYYFNEYIDNDYCGTVTVQYAGKLQPYDTALVQAKHR